MSTSRVPQGVHLRSGGRPLHSPQRDGCRKALINASLLEITSSLGPSLHSLSCNRPAWSTPSSLRRLWVWHLVQLRLSGVGFGQRAACPPRICDFPLSVTIKQFISAESSPGSSEIPPSTTRSVAGAESGSRSSTGQSPARLNPERLFAQQGANILRKEERPEQRQSLVLQALKLGPRKSQLMHLVGSQHGPFAITAVLECFFESSGNVNSKRPQHMAPAAAESVRRSINRSPLSEGSPEAVLFRQVERG